MAKKSMNPADAHRKAQRQKEIKRNKEDRKKVREVATLKKDTGGLEGRIRTLAAIAKPSKADDQELAALRSELEYTTKLKQEYVEKHPEHRKFVYAREAAEEKARLEREEKGEGSSASAAASEGAPASGGRGGGRGLYDENGRLRRPERSAYYDPILNPYGVPPPGMPYRERPPTPEPLPKELQSESEEESSDDDSDDDFALPSGPRPGADGASEDDDDDGSGSDSDDSIVFPSGPPPPKPVDQPPLPPGPPPPFGMPAFNPHVPPPGFYPPMPTLPTQMMHPHPAMMMGGPPPPPQFYGRPPLPPNVHVPYQPGGGAGGPPQGYPHRQARPPPPGGPGRRPPPPPNGGGPAPPSSSSSSSLPAKPASLPANPTKPTPAPKPKPPPPATLSALDALSSSATSGGATTSAAPVLRDFARENAAFVPAAVKRRRKEDELKAAKRVKAAPDVGLALDDGGDAGDEGGWGAPLEGFDEGPSVNDYAPLEGFDAPAPPPAPAPAPIVPKAKPSGPVSFGGANNPLLGGLASVLGKAGFGPRLPGAAGTAPATAPGAEKKKADRDGYEGFLKGLDGLDK